MVRAEATGELSWCCGMVEFGHWFNRSHTQFSFFYQSLERKAKEFSCLIHIRTPKAIHVVKTYSLLQRILTIFISLLLATLSQI
jgi:hypothetical protein